MTTPNPIPSLGANLNDIMLAFRRLDVRNCGLLITEAAIIGGNLRFRWMADGKLGVVVGEICLRAATPAEYDELEDAIELGQVQIYEKPRYVSGQIATQTVRHQATGNPLDPNSEAARRQRERWAQADALRGLNGGFGVSPVSPALPN